ncbi:unnamed protein product [Durusdinium trenchii]|uniref:Uncharacterized protein n=1 Tax=Durusdinium trenchii TaxID=1381693 RepID=A0ABP0IID0_9DINO
MSKQQQRNQQKRAAKKEAKAAEEAAAVAGAGSRISASITAADLVQSGESLVLGSCIAHYAPKLPDLLKENGEDATQEKAKEPAEEKESAEAEAERSGAGSPSDAFAELTTRLAWSNPLGLARPLSGEDAIAQWKALSQLEVDGGPRKSKRGSPSMDKIMANLSEFLPQYLHILLVLGMLHAFLFRSYFACLPWLVLWQTVSLLVPLETLEQVPQVPLSQCPVKFRVAGTVALHALMLLFFVFELIWCMNFLVKILVFGLLTLHAHSVKPIAVGDLPTAEQLFGRLEEWQLRPDAGQPEELGERAKDAACRFWAKGKCTKGTVMAAAQLDLTEPERLTAARGPEEMEGRGCFPALGGQEAGRRHSDECQFLMRKELEFEVKKAKIFVMGQCLNLAFAIVVAPNKKPEKSDKKRKALEDAAEGLKAAKDRVSFWIFNPAPLWYRQVHRHHVDMMIHAKRRLEKAGYEVVSGLLAITNSEFVRRKKDTDPMVDQHRVATLQIACESVRGGWLKPDLRGIKYSSAGRMVETLRGEIKDAIIFTVCGADTLVRLCRNGSKFNQPMVVFARPGINNQVVKDTVNVSEQAGYQVFWMEELKGGPISSARVRHTLAEENEPLLYQLCTEAVADYLWEFRQELFSENAENAAAPYAAAPYAASRATGATLSMDRPGPRQIEEAPSLLGLVVGISGAPSSGKSLLGAQLQKALSDQNFPCILISQQQFHLGDSAGKNSWWWENGRWLGYWESPDATDWQALQQAVVNAAETETSIVLVEGGGLFWEKAVSQMLQCLIWLDLDEETCWNRRGRTCYPPGWRPKRYFKWLWGGHQEHQQLALGAQGPLAPGCDGRSKRLGAMKCLGLHGLDQPEALVSRASSALLWWRHQKREPPPEAEMQ